VAAEVSKGKYWPLLLIPPAIILVYIYFTYDPSIYPFPGCPSKKYLGIACPGCGSQRALHHLLHGDLVGGFMYNPLLVLAIPYVILGYVFQIKNIRNTYPKIRKVLFGTRTIWIIFVLVILYWIVRNIFRF
jgi:hypothetical protein